MTVYCVFGVTFHEGRELLGIYTIKLFALVRRNDIKELNLHDDVIIEEVKLDTNLEYLI